MRTISVSSNARLFLAHIPHGSSIEEELMGFLKTKAFSFAHVTVWGECESATMELMTPDGPVGRSLNDSLISFRAEGFLSPSEPFRLYGWMAAVVDGERISFRGVLKDAKILSAEARIEAYAETVVDRVENPIFGSMVWRNAAAKKIDAKKRRRSGSTIPSLGSAATSRFEKERGEARMAEDINPLRPGDVIIHHSFGECEVTQVLDSEDVVLLKVKGPPTREVRLALRVLKLDKVEERSDGITIYKAHPRGR